MVTMAREQLPQRRLCETISFTLGGLTYQATVGFYSDGRPGEIFLDCAKSGTDAQINARDAAIALSMALQFGASLEAVRGALSRQESGEADGPLGRLLDILVR